jgi:hypothetical protein
MTLPSLVKRSLLHELQNVEERPLIKPIAPFESLILKVKAGP